jgi:hypothetical protein
VLAQDWRHKLGKSLTPNQQHLGARARAGALQRPRVLINACVPLPHCPQQLRVCVPQQARAGAAHEPEHIWGQQEGDAAARVPNAEPLLKASARSARGVCVCLSNTVLARRLVRHQYVCISAEQQTQDIFPAPCHSGAPAPGVVGGSVKDQMIAIAHGQELAALR